MTGIITRQEAKARGLKRYHTGEACPKGHVAERLVSNCLCCGCRAVARQTEEYRASHAERMRNRTPNSRARAAELEHQRRLDPEYRARLVERERKRKLDPDVRAQERKRRLDPEVRARGREYQRQRRLDPEYRARQRERERERERYGTKRLNDEYNHFLRGLEREESEPTI